MKLLCGNFSFLQHVLQNSSTCTHHPELLSHWQVFLTACPASWYQVLF
jgi:pterin-4a-carbinolamine dehydratase